MIDMHSHIVFDVDDGPKTIEESLNLLDIAYEQGVRVVVATSHRRKGMFETPETIIKSNFTSLKLAVKERYSDLALIFGGELYYTKDLPKKLSEKKVPTLNGSSLVLLEFSKGTSWREIKEAVNEILLLGLTPLLAHIERYDALSFDKNKVRELIDRGCYTQINSNHVLKPKLFKDSAKEFKKRARYFLENQLVHVVASDMHNLDKRPPYMKQAYEVISDEYGSGVAKKLFRDNPQALLENQYI